jgi:hypothetical protein
VSRVVGNEVEVAAILVYRSGRGEALSRCVAGDMDVFGGERRRREKKKEERSGRGESNSRLELGRLLLCH